MTGGVGGDLRPELNRDYAVRNRDFIKRLVHPNPQSRNRLGHLIGVSNGFNGGDYSAGLGIFGGNVCSQIPALGYRRDIAVFIRFASVYPRPGKSFVYPYYVKILRVILRIRRELLRFFTNQDCTRKIRVSAAFCPWPVILLRLAIRTDKNPVQI